MNGPGISDMRALLLLFLVAFSVASYASCMTPLPNHLVKVESSQIDGLPSEIVKIKISYLKEIDGWPLSSVALHYRSDSGGHFIQSELFREESGEFLVSEFVFNEIHLSSTSLSIIYESPDSDCGKIFTFGE